MQDKKSFNKFLKEKKVGIFVIAKLGSKRLKNKIKINVNQLTLIEILLQRLIKQIGNKNLVICSSGKASKKFLQPFKKKYKIKLFFGKNKNVLRRILDCMNNFNYKHFVRVTGDNPFTDCDTVKKMVKSHLQKNNDYTYTNSLPRGMKPEVFSLEALNRCIVRINDQNSTEYLTYFFLRRDIYKIGNLKVKKFFNIQNKFNISIDYSKDLNLLKKIIKSNKGDIHINSYKIIKFLKDKTFPVNVPKKVPLKCTSYDARYFFDGSKKYINLY
tara:strand:- start:791 stop:1603 length:813 start_codon:yes stop_codon:yes gene_type:complete